MYKIAVFIICGLLIGCGSSKKVRTKNKTAKITNEKNCAASKDTSLDEVSANILVQTVTLKRANTKVKYKDCDEKEIAARQEAKSEAASVELKLKEDFENVKNGFKVSVVNRANCETGVYQASLKDNKLALPLSLEKSSKELEVVGGRENYIDYKVHECEELSSEKRCVKSHVVEHGTLVLTVKVDSAKGADDTKEILVCRKTKK